MPPYQKNGHFKGVALNIGWTVRIRNNYNFRIAFLTNDVKKIFDLREGFIGGR